MTPMPKGRMAVSAIRLPVLLPLLAVLRAILRSYAVNSG